MVVLRHRRPRPRLRREDVHYLRRSPAAKRRHTHPENTLRLLPHFHFFVFFSADLLASRESPPSPGFTFPALATCYLSRLEVARASQLLGRPRFGGMTLLPFVQPATLGETRPREREKEKERDYVCWVQGKPLSIYRTSRGQECRNRGRKAHCSRFHPCFCLHT